MPNGICPKDRKNFKKNLKTVFTNHTVGGSAGIVILRLWIVK